MSDDRLVDYYLDYGPSRFGPVKKRSLQTKVKQFNLPIIRTGWSTLIDPQAGDDRLREYARGAPEPRRGRGRPRTGG